MLLKSKSAIFLCCRCCKTSSQRELSQFHCCFREIFINEDSCVFNFFAFRKTLCLYLELKNLQSTFRGFDLFIWNLPMRWQRSISISSVISNLFLVIFITSFFEIFPGFASCFWDAIHPNIAPSRSVLKSR